MNLFKHGKIWFLVLILITFYTLVANIGASSHKAFESDSYIMSHINNSYDQKMYFQWHDFYNYMVFIVNNTPEDANIMIPPFVEPQWARTSNISLVRYFLFPRNIVQNADKNILDVVSVPKGTYILSVRSELGCDNGDCKVWPSQGFEVEEVIVKDSTSKEPRIIKQNYLYDPNDLGNSFGLLKI